MENIKVARLIPLCLISVLMGQLLPRVIQSTPLLIVAAILYLAVLLAVDVAFARKKNS